MDANPPSRPSRVANLAQRLSRFMQTPAGTRIATIGPVAWVTRILVRSLARRQILHGPEALLPAKRIANADLESTLKSIVTDVVETLGYFGAMVATYDPDGALPVRAWFFDPQIVSEEQFTIWEAQISQLSSKRFVSLSDPRTSRVYIDRPEYRDNLSSKAFSQQQPVSSAELFDLFRPIVPELAAPAIKGIQEAIGIQEVIAVPFFLETSIDRVTRPEFVGNLFVLSRSPITTHERQVLAAFGRQAAAAILSDRRRSQTEAVLRLIFDIQTNLVDEAQILQRIVEGVVHHLGYIGAFVATYEADDSLAVQAWHFDPAVVSREQILTWEAQISQLTPERPIGLDPSRARVYVHDPEYRENLSARAFFEQRPVYTSDLYDLFRPVVPESSIPALQGIQEALHVQLAVAVPFFLSSPEREGRAPAFVGNLFALSRVAMFSSAEIEVLQAFGQQAAAGLHNARLYRQAESRRKASEIFGKMAFSAAASVHDLKNKVGVIRGNLQVLKILPLEQLIEIRDQLTEPVFRNLDQTADILDSLHEPWQQVPDVEIDINECLERAIVKGLPSRESSQLRVIRELSPELPGIPGSRDMMVEMFKVLLKNAAEAIAEQGRPGEILVRSRRCDEVNIEITISDNGVGIKREHLERIFEMRWSTKGGAGLGFGLFWVRDYIEGLGGTVSVQSTYGQGTTFLITIPYPGQRLS